MRRTDEFTDAERRVLTVLARFGSNRLLGPGTIGGQIWGSPHRKPQDYARTAGRILNRLRDRGLVEWTSFRGFEGEAQDWGWRLSARGRETFGKEVERMDLARMKEAVRDLIIGAGFEVREDYSGRGMNGKTCLGFVVESRGGGGIFEAAVELTAQAASEFEGIDEFEEVIQALKGAKTDDLGRGSIIYFPNLLTD